MTGPASYYGARDFGRRTKAVGGAAFTRRIDAWCDRLQADDANAAGHVAAPAFGDGHRRVSRVMP